MKVERDQKGALDHLDKNKENSTKMSNLNNQLRLAKIEFKRLKDMQREENRIVNSQHENIVRMEEKCKKITQLIKEQKNKN